MPIVGLDHVQLAMPAAGEDLARRFYVGVLGLEEIPKPEPLAGRGGAWFRRGAVELTSGLKGISAGAQSPSGVACRRAARADRSLCGRRLSG
jgi:catechol 2,3-dioxygenase-like lactoylglutathione lyase family enzyme